MNNSNNFLKLLNTVTTPSITNVGYLYYEYKVSSTETLSDSLLSNPVNTIIINDNTSIKKFVDKSIIQTNSEVLYTIVIKNNDSFNTISDISFTDTIPLTTTFIPNSFTVNGTPYTGANPENSINLGLTLSSGETATLTFKVTGNGTDGLFTNSGFIKYTLNLLGKSIPGSQNSNIVSTIYRNLIFTIKKYTNKTYADKGDIIDYTLVVLNTGNVELENVVISDTIPFGTSFVNNSTTLNGTPISSNPENGISIAAIPKYSTSTITFKVIVV